MGFEVFNPSHAAIIDGHHKTAITQEAMGPSRHDWKIVDWDVKPQLKQTNKQNCS